MFIIRVMFWQSVKVETIVMNCCPGKQQAAVWLGLAAAVALEGGALDHLLKVSIVRAVQISIRPSGGLIDKRPYQTQIFTCME